MAGYMRFAAAAAVAGGIEHGAEVGSAADRLRQAGTRTAGRNTEVQSQQRLASPRQAAACY